MPHARGFSIVLGLMLAAALVAPTALALDSSMEALRVTGERSAHEKFPAIDGRGILVAVLDTGVDDSHPTFGDAFVTGVDVSRPPDNLTVPPVAESPCTNPDDADGHGTHVAAIALGRGAPAGEKRGVAPGALLVDVKVAADLSGVSLSGLERGLEWVKAYNAGEAACIESAHPRIHVVSISFAGLGPGDPADATSRLVDALAASGVAVVVAAGNCGPGSSPDAGIGAGFPMALPGVGCESTGENTIASPAVAKGAIAVAAVDGHGTADRDDDDVADYSSRGPNGAEAKPNVAAPGSAIESARANPIPGAAPSGWATMSGTSMAAPHVAGVAALLLQADPALGGAGVKRILQDTAEDRGASGWDAAWGHGYVDAYAALAHALGRENLPPVPAFVATCDALSCAFDASASADPDGSVASHAWTFGDDSAAEGARASHDFLFAGTFRVVLTVEDDMGASATLERLVVVSLPASGEDDASRAAVGASSDDDAAADATPRPPRAIATASPQEAPLGSTFTLDASASEAGSSPIVSYAWDVDGDGDAEADGPVFAWTPTDAGAYAVRVLVADASGARDVATVAVIALEPEGGGGGDGDAPTTDATPPDVVILSPQPGVVVDGSPTVRWRARDDASGVVSTRILLDGVDVAATPLEEFFLVADPGVHSLVLRVTDAAGNVAEAETTFTIAGADENDAAAGEPEPTLRDRGASAATTTGGERDVPAPPIGIVLMAAAAVAVAARVRRNGA